jgi:DNA-binding transcriptional regulator WhiA|tara:strand:- start:4 stop:264 length:261 start_codon:yes stop_codon:yes gene_type:complete
MNNKKHGGKRAGAGRPKSIIKIVEDTDFTNLKPRELKRIAQLIVDNINKYNLQSIEYVLSLAFGKAGVKEVVKREPLDFTLRGFFE